MNLDKLKQLANKATPGPWRVGHRHHKGNSALVTTQCPARWIVADCEPSIPHTFALASSEPENGNSEYIAALNPKTALELIGEIERLHAIVDKLPRTANDVPVVPGMRVWRHEWPTTLGEKVLEVDGTNRMRLDGCGSMYSGSVVYSTREAAEVAGGK